MRGSATQPNPIRTSKTLINHPVSVNIKSCNSVKNIGKMQNKIKVSIIKLGRNI